MVIVDTTVWIDFLNASTNPHVAWLDREVMQQRLGLTDLILCEVLQGIRNDSHFVQVKNLLSRFEIFPNGGTDLAIAAAQNYRQLRVKGHTIRRTMDCLIATFCLEHGHELLHRDRDFDVFERHLGLRVVHP